jgi:hypothetical protein
MLYFRLFVKIFFTSFIILFNIIDLNNNTQYNNFEFNCIQLNNSNNANNLYNNVESSDLSNDKTIVINIELNNDNNDNGEKDNNS